jgi:hypothetical protein
MLAEQEKNMKPLQPTFKKILYQLNEGICIPIRYHTQFVQKKISGTSTNCIKFSETHKLPFRGQDESETSYNHGTFLDRVSELAILYIYIKYTSKH